MTVSNNEYIYTKIKYADILHNESMIEHILLSHSFIIFLYFDLLLLLDLFDFTLAIPA